MRSQPRRLKILNAASVPAPAARPRCSSPYLVPRPLPPIAAVPSLAPLHRNRGDKARPRPLLALASRSLQAHQAGPDVRDAAIMLKSMASVDPKNTTSVDLPVPDYEKGIGNPVKGLRVGIPKGYRADGMSAEIEALWDKGAQWLKEQGAEIVESLPHTKYALPAYYIVVPLNLNLARYDGVRYGLRVPAPGSWTCMKIPVPPASAPKSAVFLFGTYVLSAGYYDAYYVGAAPRNRTIKRDFEQAWSKVDVVLTPATPSPAFAPGQSSGSGADVPGTTFSLSPRTWRDFPGIAVPREVQGRPSLGPSAHRQGF